MEFAVPAGHRRKIKEREKNDKYLDLARELKRLWNIESDGDSNCNWLTWKIDWMNWKSEEESRPSRLQHCKDRLEY